VRNLPPGPELPRAAPPPHCRRLGQAWGQGGRLRSPVHPHTGPPCVPSDRLRRRGVGGWFYRAISAVHQCISTYTPGVRYFWDAATHLFGKVSSFGPGCSTCTCTAVDPKFAQESETELRSRQSPAGKDENCTQSPVSSAVWPAGRLAAGCGSHASSSKSQLVEAVASLLRRRLLQLPLMMIMLMIDSIMDHSTPVCDTTYK
jgi:hypothetical protein